MSELEHRPIPPAGEEVHMPEPSLIPIVNAAALAVGLVSLTLDWYTVALGGVAWVITSIIWIRDVRRDIEALPLEHHH